MIQIVEDLVKELQRFDQHEAVEIAFHNEVESEMEYCEIDSVLSKFVNGKRLLCIEIEPDLSSITIAMEEYENTIQEQKEKIKELEQTIKDLQETRLTEK